MNKFRQIIYMVFWLLKSLIFRLSPLRRLLLLASIVCLALPQNAKEGNETYWGLAFVILLLILMLELKDKLLAHNELASGRAVQFALMPDKNPQLNGWDIWMFTRPANDVGGDLVDYLEVDDSKLCVFLGDVAGKGLGAALLMAKLQATIRAIACNFDSLYEFGSEINKILCRDGIPSKFVSLVYLCLEPFNGKIRILNAGHMPPIKVRNDKVTEMKRGAPALGIQKSSTYIEQSLELDSNDMLVIYSDGLTEARNIEGQFYGDIQLINLLKNLNKYSAEIAGKKIINAVDDFCGDARPNDDLSLIILKRENFDES